MNQQEKHAWDEEDESLQREFSDISELHRINKDAPTRVPSKLDRLIRKHAELVHQEDLTKSWIFSKAMLLALVMLLLFSISVMFVVIKEGKNNGAAENNAPKVSPVELWQ